VGLVPDFRIRLARSVLDTQAERKRTEDRIARLQALAARLDRIENEIDALVANIPLGDHTGFYTVVLERATESKPPNQKNHSSEVSDILASVQEPPSSGLHAGECIIRDVN
jgi:hypothetical protein